MNEFIEENRRLLRIYCTVARTIGWLLLIVGPLLLIVGLVTGLPENQRFRLYLEFRRWRTFIGSYMLSGIVVIGLAQFVRYLCENDYKPGWILRHGDKVLNLYAAVLIIEPVAWSFFQITITKNFSMYELLVGHLLSMLLPSLAYGVIFVGMGQILRRMLPMIEESKTLV